MRSVRVLLGAAALGAAALLGASACTPAAANASGVWVRVQPSTVDAGSSVSLRASCGDDVNPATISSKAFGSTTAQPIDGVLSATIQVPASTAAGTYDVDLSCHTGSRATTTLTVLNGGQGNVPAHRASVGPHTGGGFLADSEDGGIASGPLIWLGAGVAALIAAIVVGVRNQTRRVPARRR